MSVQEIVWIVFAGVFVLLFLLTGLMIIAAIAGFLPRVKDEYLPALVKAILLESAAAAVAFFVLGPSAPSLSTEPSVQEVYVVNAEGLPASFSVFSGSDTVSLRTLSPTTLKDARREVRAVGRVLYITGTPTQGPEGEVIGLGRIDTPLDSLVAWAISDEHALVIGLHLAELSVEGMRREPQTACRFLAIPFERDDGSEQVRITAAGQLFHLRSDCWAAGLGDVVLKAMTHRRSPQRYKETGDVLVGYSSQPGVDRDRYLSRAAASYLRFLARDCSMHCGEAKERIEEVLSNVRSVAGVDVADRITAAMEADAFGDFDGIAGDIEAALNPANNAQGGGRP